MKIILLIVCLIITGVIAARLKRSIGGTPMLIHEAPFFVSIQHYGEHKCGGALISRKNVLTAAQCLVDQTYNWYPRMTVVCGTDKTNTGGVLRGIEYIVYPPGFDVETLRDDIAVITLSARVEMENNGHPIALARTQPKYYEKATLVSFKTTVDPSKNSPLHGMYVQMVPFMQCAPGRRSYISLLNMFCGVIETYEQISLCDIGAPLVHDGILVGVVSSTAAPDYPHGYFAKVHEFHDFINGAMAD